MEPFLTVADTADPEQVVELVQEGDSVHFGRGGPGVDLVVRTETSPSSLSRVAGTLWRQWDQVWIANLSHSHDLLLQEASHPPEAPLPPRRPGSPLHARTVPGQRCVVTGPAGGWALVVDQRGGRTGSDPGGASGAFGRLRADRPVDGAGDEVTLRAPDVPDDLLDVAAALCEPLLVRGARLPATYARIALRLGISPKAARLRVDRLVELYEDHNPVLRRRREDQDRRLAGPELVRGAGGIWRSPAHVPPGAGGTVADDAPSPRERGPELPYSFDVAHLLVRRRLVTPADISRLDGRP